MVKMDGVVVIGVGAEKCVVLGDIEKISYAQAIAARYL